MKSWSFTRISSLVGLVVLLGLPVAAQEGPRFAWDYSDAEVDANNIDHFEIRIDGSVWVDVGMTLHSPGTYVAAVPLTSDGDHTVDIRACAGTSCQVFVSMDYSTTFTFTAVKIGHDVDILP